MLIDLPHEHIIWSASQTSASRAQCSFLDDYSRFEIVGSEEARLRAGLRPPPKLHVRFSRMQLSRRLSDARMQEKELNRSAEQARTRRRAASLAAVSSPHYASAGTDATKCVAGSSRRDVGRACGCGRVCNTRPNPAGVDLAPQSVPQFAEVSSAWCVPVPDP